MSCQNCDSDRLCEVSGKTDDAFTAIIEEEEHEGYVPKDLGIGSGSYVRFEYCLDCGQIQGDFPRKTTALEKGTQSEEDDEGEDYEEDDEGEDD